MITVENGLFLLLQAFSSGVAGYITNKYAVNMIFKEYTPLKIGGAVKKNKEKFIEEISDLVERDIINSQTIRDKVLGEDFRNSIQNMSEEFFQKSLYEVFEDKKLEEIPGWSQTLIDGEEFLKDSLNEVLPKFLNNVCEHMKIDDLLSDKQISSIVDYAYNEIIKNINSSEELKYLLSDLYEEDGNIYLNQLISKESGEKVTRIISCEIMNSNDSTSCLSLSFVVLSFSSVYLCLKSATCLLIIFCKLEKGTGICLITIFIPGILVSEDKYPSPINLG